MQVDEMEGESGVSRSIIDALHSSDLAGYQIGCESGLPQSIIDELHSSDIIKRKVKVVLLEISLMNFIFRISKEFKWNVKVVLLEISLMKFIVEISKEIK